MTEPPSPTGVRPLLAIVVTGGAPPSGEELTDLPGAGPGRDRLVVAADSGLDHAAALGLAVDVAVGDFDSVDPAVLARAEAAGTVIERHAAAKDHTDLELALVRARDAGATRIVVVGGHGGRVDHWLANALVLAGPATVGVAVEARAGRSRIVVVRSEAEVNGAVGELVSLLAVHGPAEGVRTEGLLFPLHGERLEPGSSRGVSNELVAPVATVTVEGGVLLAVLPGERGVLGPSAQG